MADISYTQTVTSSIFEICKKNDAERLRQLLEEGADLYAKDECGYTPLHIAICSHSIECLKVLLDYGVEPNIKYMDEYNLLIHAAFNDCVEFFQLLVERGENLTIKENNYHTTALHIAVMNDSPKVIQFLIVHGMDPNIKNIGGETPLHIAASDNSLDCAKILLENGADPNIKDEHEHTPIFNAVECDDSDYTLEMVRLLLENGADPNINYEGVSPLYIAAENDSTYSMKLLLEFGADPTMKDGVGKTFLDYIILKEAREEIENYMKELECYAIKEPI